MQYASTINQKWNKKLRELQTVVKTHVEQLNSSQPQLPPKVPQPPNDPIVNAQPLPPPNVLPLPNDISVSKIHSSRDVNSIKVSDNVARDSSSISSKRKAPTEFLEAPEKVKKMKDEELVDIKLLNAGAAGKHTIITHSGIRFFSYCQNSVDVYRKLSITTVLDLTIPDTLYDVLGMSLTYLSSCDKEKFFAKPVSMLYYQQIVV